MKVVLPLSVAALGYLTYIIIRLEMFNWVPVWEYYQHI